MTICPARGCEGTCGCPRSTDETSEVKSTISKKVRARLGLPLRIGWKCQVCQNKLTIQQVPVVTWQTIDTFFSFLRYIIKHQPVDYFINCLALSKIEWGSSPWNGICSLSPPHPSRFVPLSYQYCSSAVRSSPVGKTYM